MDEVRATRHEVRVLREEQKKNTILLQKLQENTVTVSKELEKMQEKTFAVQGSDFQVSILQIHVHAFWIWQTGYNIITVV